MIINVVKKENKDAEYELIEVVERHGRQAFIKQGKTWRQDGCRKKVSYKGKKYKTFYLPRRYGKTSGNCIDISPRWIYW